MVTESPAYFEIIDFIAAGSTPVALAEYRPSAEAQRRIDDLIEREKAELDHFMELEHILRMAKARACQILANGE